MPEHPQTVRHLESASLNRVVAGLRAFWTVLAASASS